MKIALTGHTNIEKCYGLKITNDGNVYNKEAYDKAYNEIENEIFNIINNYGINIEEVTLISGMARGADEILAEIAYRNNMNLILSIPHTIQWHKNRDVSTKGTRVQALEYDKYLNYEKSKIFEIKKSYGSGNHLYANFARNQHMVDNCDILISFKRYDSSGTDHCIKEGKKQNKYLGNVGFLDFKDSLNLDI